MTQLARTSGPVEPKRTPLTALARAAGIISAGNITSRLLGMLRELIKARLFGASGLVSAFEVANIIPTMVYDLLIGGMISSALVPVLSDYHKEERRDQFWQLISILLSVAAAALAVLLVFAELLAPEIVWLFGARHFADPNLMSVATKMLQLMLPAILFLNISGLVTGTLFSLRRFTLPAFTAAAFNACVIIFALTNPDRIESLAIGVLVGSILQVVMQLPHLDLQRLGWKFDFRHPALRKIAKLYAPIVLGVVVSQIAIAISFNLATITGDESVAIMRYATTLVQFPLGLVATAVSVAILPTLARQATPNAQTGEYESTLARGMSMVITLILPACIGLFLLSTPTVKLAFERGDFLPSDTALTSTVLRYYLIGLPFAAIDQLLVFASYAKKNTLAPALVGVASVVVYLIVAFVLIEPLGLISLMIADSVKHIFHTIVMTYILRRSLSPEVSSITSTINKSLLATLIMGAAVFGSTQLMPEPSDMISNATYLILAAIVGLIVYFGVLALMKSPELDLIKRAVSRSDE